MSSTVSYWFWRFDEHFALSHLPLIWFHIDSFHQVFHSSSHISAPSWPSLLGEDSISKEQINSRGWTVLPNEPYICHYTVTESVNALNRYLFKNRSCWKLRHWKGNEGGLEYHIKSIIMMNSKFDMRYVEIALTTSVTECLSTSSS